MKTPILIAAALIAASLPAQQPTDPVDTQTDVTYASVGGTDLKLDVFRPAERETNMRPAVILIHGGGWTSLDKSTMRGMGNFLARNGFVAFSIDYRLFQGTNNRWPAQLDDAQRAVRWVRANAANYGVDPRHIGAFGHSAGGQLAAMLGMLDTRDNSDKALAKYSSRVEAVVDVSAPSDLTAQHDKESVEFLTAFLGADSSQHAVWRDASPVFRAAKGDAPFLVIHGTQDPSVPIAQAQELADTLHAVGVPVSFVKIEGGHTFQDQAAKRQLAIESLAFFNQYLGG
jgi:acetyl esterase/lipase